MFRLPDVGKNDKGDKAVGIRLVLDSLVIQRKGELPVPSTTR
jgi:hypothetical protein